MTLFSRRRPLRLPSLRGGVSPVLLAPQRGTSTCPLCGHHGEVFLRPADDAPLVCRDCYEEYRR